MGEKLDGDEVVGHKTFIENGHFRHTSLTRREADALIESTEIARVKRAADMPAETDAVKELWRAYYRLTELGWKDPVYAHELKKEGVECFIIESGSSGIHRGYYHAVNGQDVWWIGSEGCPSHPRLIKAIAPAVETE